MKSVSYLSNMCRVVGLQGKTATRPNYWLKIQNKIISKRRKNKLDLITKIIANWLNFRGKPIRAFTNEAH
jgi:anaerobic ribonucleoside-triphosphate reductase